MTYSIPKSHPCPQSHPSMAVGPWHPAGSWSVCTLHCWLYLSTLTLSPGPSLPWSLVPSAGSGRPHLVGHLCIREVPAGFREAAPQAH